MNSHSSSFGHPLLLGMLVAAACVTMPSTSWAAPGEPPLVFWHSEPAKPGSTVLVDGHAFDTQAQIQYLRLPDDAPGHPGDAVLPGTGFMNTGLLRGDAQHLSFVLPQSAGSGVFAWRVRNADGTPGATRLLNGPQPWFMQSDVGRRATPGGWFVVHGQQMQWGQQAASAALVLNGTVVAVMPARPGGSAFEQTFDIPWQLAPGSYEVHVHNGAGGPAAWVNLSTMIQPAEATLIVAGSSALWEIQARAKPEVVIDIGPGLPAGMQNWDDMFDSALNQLKNQGGGVLRVREGSYPLTRRLVLPDHTIVIGEGMDRTVLQWSAPFSQPDPETVRAPLVRGIVLRKSPYLRGTFSLEDITLDRSFEEPLVVNPSGQKDSAGAACIERVSTGDDDLQYAWFRRMACRAPNTAQNTAEFRTVADQSWGKRAAIFLRASRSTEISDSVFDYAVGFYLHGGGQENTHVRLERNQVSWRYAPISQLYGLRNLRFQGNTVTMRGSLLENGLAKDADVGSGFGSFGYNVREVYYGRNSFLRESSGTPEPVLGFTTDGVSSAYLGRVRGNGLQQVLTGLGGPAGTGHTANTDQYAHPYVLPGAMVQILAGRGAGQWRELTTPAVNTTSVQINKPWEVEPDDTSWLGINDQLGRMLIVHNDFANAPKLQLYFATHDVVVAENRMGHGGAPANLSVWRGMLGSAYMSLTRGLHIQLMDNGIGDNGANYSEAGFPDFEANEARGIYVDANLLSNRDAFAAPMVYRGNSRITAPPYVGRYLLNLNEKRPGVLLEQNADVDALRYPVSLGSAPSLIVRQLGAPGGVPAPIVESSTGNTLNLGTGLLYGFSGNQINFARGAWDTAVNDGGTWGRRNATDGVTEGVAADIQASSGTANSPWLQLDLRQQVNIQSVVLRSLAVNPTGAYGSYIAISASPFIDSTLSQASQRSGVQVFGPINASTSFPLPTPMQGRYLRLWKDMPGTSQGRIDLAEIEVYGSTP